MDKVQCKLCGNEVKIGYRMMHLMRKHQDQLGKWEIEWSKNNSMWKFMKKLKAKEAWCDDQFKHE